MSLIHSFSVPESPYAIQAVASFHPCLGLPHIHFTTSPAHAEAHSPLPRLTMPQVLLTSVSMLASCFDSPLCRPCVLQTLRPLRPPRLLHPLSSVPSILSIHSPPSPPSPGLLMFCHVDQTQGSSD